MPADVIPDDFYDENLDRDIFEQILEMDDDPQDREFSMSIVFDFFTQADNTFQDMDSALDHKDLPKLSALGHFLKGSSATLGLNKVKDSCEKIQHYGAKKDASGQNDEDDEELCLKRCKEAITQAKSDFDIAKAKLESFYNTDED